MTSTIPRIRRRAPAAPVAPLAADATVALPNAAPLTLAIEYLPIESLRAAERQLRKHSTKKLVTLRGAIAQFGLTVPVMIDPDNVILDGHAIWSAARDLGYTEVPTIRLSHLGPEQQRMYRIAVNKLAENTPWDEDLLKLELLAVTPKMLELEIAPEILGFSTAEFDLLTSTALVAEADDPLTDPPRVATSRLGDLFILGEHRLLCADALLPESYARVMAGEKARMVLTDPPYNLDVSVISGLGKARHENFAMGSGEMTPAQFRTFLKAYMERLVEVSVNGAIHIHCMDWRHIATLITAGEEVYSSPLKQMIVWNKGVGGMGSFYRSQHELMAVFKVGDAPHVNTFELGQTGRSRTNVWDYAGANTFRKGREADLAAHPTVKPTPLVMDAIKDVSRPGEIVLDCFGGSGTMILAAEKTRRRARVIEIDPIYVDVAITRWQALTGKEAILETTGQSFNALKRLRSSGEEA